jgi:hypothetical protein
MVFMGLSSFQYLNIHYIIYNVYSHGGRGFGLAAGVRAKGEDRSGQGPIGARMGAPVQ